MGKPNHAAARSEQGFRDMTPVEFLLACLAGTGVAQILGTAPWFRRRPIGDRIAPYSRGSRRSSAPSTSEASLRLVLEPLIMDLGGRVSRLFGIATDLETRLARAESNSAPYSFRLRQITLSLLALGCGVLAAISLKPPPSLTLAILIGAPLLTVLAIEQSLSSQISDRQKRLQAELPVVTEQLGMLLSAGYSLTAAIARLAERGSGVAASDLRRVTLEIRQGVPESSAFEHWADLSGLESVRRLVRVLGLHSEAGDLSLLIAEEARAVRAEAHRDLVAAIEKRAQLVWIPVTVATLVPGLIFLAVPFYSAMAQVTGG
ncbi:MAG TPA: type II secretion system F family protein [Microthrixaceae bacterium]|nr:type II secretion system F family protein [Microthrixaceae bacterium]